MPVKILDNITVIECATFVTGPYATALLADLGARVIKIESAPDGDPYRYFAPDPAFSFNFAHLNRNKESLVLDLKAPAGKAICLELLENADVFVENFRPGTAGRLGIGYETVQAINTKIVYCSISAFGQSGPYAEKPGFDTLGQAMSGLLSLLSDPNDPKVMGMAVSDYVTGLSAGYGILAALLARTEFRRRLPGRDVIVAGDVVVHRRDRGGLSSNRQRAQPHGASEKCPCVRGGLPGWQAAGDSLFGAGEVLVGAFAGCRAHGHRRG